MEPGPWDFGWEAVVAIATAVLAFFTYRMAAKTRDLASATRDELTNSWRPVVVVVDPRSSFKADWIAKVRADLEAQGQEWQLQHSGGLEQLEFVVRNAGRGIALNAHIEIRWKGHGQHHQSVATELSLLEPGSQVSPPRISLGGIPHDVRLLTVFVRYRDDGGREHVTRARLERMSDSPAGGDANERIAHYLIAEQVFSPSDEAPNPLGFRWADADAAQYEEIERHPFDKQRKDRRLRRASKTTGDDPSD